MRVAVLQCNHETNSFSPVPTTLADYVFYDYLHDDLSPRETLGWNSEMVGFLEELAGQSVDVVPTVAGRARSGGNMTADATENILKRFVSALGEAGPVDGAYLALHGSTVGDGHLDITGEILEKVRQFYGPSVPIVCSLDFHANVTPTMARQCNAIIGYRTFPHIDLNLTGRRAARLLVATLRKQITPRNILVRLPMILPAEVTGDRQPPMSGLIARLSELEKQAGIAQAALFCVQPWLDVVDLGCSVVLVADGDARAAEQAALALAHDYWRLRKEFHVPLVSPAEAVQRAKRSPGPVIMSDSADATTSGASGDSTAILEELIKQEAPGPNLVTVTDAEAAAQAWAAGVGAVLDLAIGGKYDPSRYKTLHLRVSVASLHDGLFVGKGPMLTGHHFDMGRTAVLRCGGTYIVAMSKAVANLDPELYRSVGLEPATARTVVVKSPLGFRAAYEPIAQEIVIVDVPGSVTPHLTLIPFTMVKRPLYPLDDMDDYQVSLEKLS